MRLHNYEVRCIYIRTILYETKAPKRIVTREHNEMINISAVKLKQNRMQTPECLFTLRYPLPARYSSSPAVRNPRTFVCFLYLTQVRSFLSWLLSPPRIKKHVCLAEGTIVMLLYHIILILCSHEKIELTV